jgi:excisionase family DNA binding protein
MQTAYLTVPQVAAELDISADGVYKLIKRGRLPAIRRSERGLRISRVALDAYQRRLRHGGISLMPMPQPSADMEASRADFERETGFSPREWERRWKADEIEDSTENMRRAIRALALLLNERHEPVGHTIDGTAHDIPA